MDSNLPKGFTVDSTELPAGFTIDESVGGIVEPVMAIGSSIGREVIGGLAGLAQSLNPYADEGAGAAMVDDFRQGAFKPETQAGKENLKLFGELVQKGVDVVNYPISGLFGLSELMSGEGIDKAVDTITSVQDKGLGKTLGERSFEETGSPIQATIGEMFPEFAMSLTAARPIAKAPGTAIAAAKSSLPVVQKTVKTALTPFTRQSKANSRMTELLQMDDIPDKAVGYDIVMPKEKANQTSFQKFKNDVLRMDEPKIVSNQFEQEAMKQGFDKGVLGSIKNATPETKARMLEMVDIAEQISNRRELAQKMRSSNVVGDAMIDRIKKVLEVNKDAGSRVGMESKLLIGQKVDFDPVINNFTESLEDLGITLKQTKDGVVTDFKGSDIQGMSGLENSIKRVVTRMRDTKDIDAYALHKIKQFIDQNISYGKNQHGLSGRAEGVLTSLRADISNLLNDNFDNYAKANSDYSETITAIDNIRKASPKFDPKNLSKGYLGTQARKLTGNWANKDDMLDAINIIDQLAVKHGGIYNDNVLSLNMLVDELNSVFGTQARTSLQGEMAKGVKEGLKGSVKDVAIDKVAEAAEAARGINEEGAFKAIKALLSEK